MLRVGTLDARSVQRDLASDLHRFHFFKVVRHFGLCCQYAVQGIVTKD